MRIILAALGVAVLGWSAYWLWTAASLERAIGDWLEARRAEGWQAEASEIGTAGYPLRFETRLEELALADPETGLAWQAPALVIAREAVAPRALTIAWPDVNVLRSPARSVTLRSDALAAALTVGPGGALPLRRAEIRATTLTVEEGGGTVASMADLQADATLRDAAAHVYEVTLEAEGIALSAPVLRSLDPDLPQSLDSARLDLTARFDRPWDLRALETARPQPRALTLHLLEAGWGPMALRMTAELEIDASGMPEGDLTIQARNWRDMLTVAEQTGAVPPQLIGALSEGLRLLAGLSGNPDSLDVTLRLARGQIFIGVLPLGPAPRLQLR